MRTTTTKTQQRQQRRQRQDDDDKDDDDDEDDDDNDNKTTTRGDDMGQGTRAMRDNNDEDEVEVTEKAVLRPPCGLNHGAETHYNQLTYYKTSLRH